jgi:hypothetical protein
MVGVTGRRVALYASAVAVALFCVRLLGEPWSSHFPPKFPDAFNPGRNDTYYAVSQLSPFRPSFYTSPRPIVYPAFVWLLARDSAIIVVAQTAVYCAAVGALCATAWRYLQTRLVAVLAIVGFVLIAVEARFAMWATQILSESLGISLAILAIAAWWRLAADPTPRRAVWPWVWTIAWLLERDAHTIPVAVVVVPIAVTAAFLARDLAEDVKRRLLSGALIALVACAYVYVAQKSSGRNRYSLQNTVGIRVLPDPSLRQWFVDGGMPVNDALLSRQGKSAFDDNRQFDTDPQLARFRKWADGPGNRRMLESLVLRAPDWYRMLDRQAPSIFADDFAVYDNYGVLNRLPRRPPVHVAGPDSRKAAIVWIGLAVVALGGALALARRRGPLIFAAGGLAVALVDIYSSFAGDPLEIDRHLVGPLNRLSVMLVITVAIAADVLWQQWRSPASPAQDEAQLALALDG